MSNSPVDAIAQGLSFQGINARSTAIFADHLPGRRSGASLGHGMAAIRTANSTHRIGDTRSGAWSKRPLSWLSMTPEQVLSHPARILSTGQRESYFTEGYLGVESLISEDWLERLREATEESVAGAAAVTESDGVFDVAPGHTPDRPRLRRVRLPDDQHPTFWEFATDVIADVAADLVGPDVVFHHSKLNFKWDQHDDAVNWHQDIQFYPHTNYSPLTIGTYLTDTGRDDGPLMVVARSHEGPLHDQYDADGNWVGRLSDEAAAAIDPERVAYLTGPAGSITVHNSRSVHGSAPSSSDSNRPLLLNAYASADAFPYTPQPQPSAHAGEVVRGKSARWAHHDPRPCLIPPAWATGYASIFAAQSGKDTG